MGFWCEVRAQNTLQIRSLFHLEDVAGSILGVYLILLCPWFTAASSHSCSLINVPMGLLAAGIELCCVHGQRVNS